MAEWILLGYSLKNDSWKNKDVNSYWRLSSLGLKYLFTNVPRGHDSGVMNVSNAVWNFSASTVTATWNEQYRCSSSVLRLVSSDG